MTLHVFDEPSRINFWLQWGAGIEPHDLHCACGGEWLEGRCILQGTLNGDAWELARAKADLIAVIRRDWRSLVTFCAACLALAELAMWAWRSW